MVDDVVPKGSRPDGFGERQNPSVNVEHFNYTPNDIHSLAILAERSERLAEKVIDNADAANAREHGTERFGLVVTAILLALVVGAVVTSIVFGGLLTTVATIGLVVALSFFVVVAITGEWQDTGWMGQFLDKTIGKLGGKGADNDAES